MIHLDIFRLLQMPLTLALCLFAGNSIYAAEDNTKVIEVKMGDYRFMPHEIQLIANQPAIIRLVNTDSITPHNFVLEDPVNDLDINVDVRAGKSVDVQLSPLAAGHYTFYCSKKLMFMKSHREKGMEGTLIVSPE